MSPCYDWIAAVGSIWIALLWVGSVAADETRDSAHYGPDRPVDFLHMRLELDFTGDAIDRKTCNGRVEYRLRPRGGPTRTIRLAAIDMEILDVELVGQRQVPEFWYDDQELTVELARDVDTGETIQLAVRYRLQDPPSGLHFVLPNASAPETPTLVYTFSEPLLTRYWVPSHDWPNERWISDLLIKVPEGYSVVAHGALVGEERSADHTVFHWRSEVPLDPHMMGFVVGELVKLESAWHDLPLTVYTQPGTEPAARFTFRRVGEILEFFARTLSVDYPFPGYLHVGVVGHEHGAMEQAGFSIVDPYFMTSGLAGEMPVERFEENFISHMAAHQWFGGIVNYRSLAQMWLNEGFASLLAAMWIAHDEAPGSFEIRMWNIAQRIVENDPIETGEPMVNRDVADDPVRVFSFDGGKVYWKGAWVLNMLRHRLGDELFWSSVAAFLEDYRWQGVESADLRRSLERASGRDLVQFFSQWVDRPGLPHLSVETSWDGHADKLTVTIRQTQKADAETPAFTFPLDLHFRVDGKDRYVSTDIDASRHELSYELESEPTQVCIDPHGGLLKSLELQMPRAMLTEQAISGSTALCRLVAVEELAGDDRPGSVNTLEQVLRSDRQNSRVRARAAFGLGAMQTEAALEALLAAVRAGLGDERALEASIAALGQYIVSAPAHDLVLLNADPASPLLVETAAVRALGMMRPDLERTRAGLDVLLRAVNKPTRRWVRLAAFESLESLDDPAAYDTLLTLAQPARGDRLRGSAIRALGSLGRHDSLRDRTRRQLTAWLFDPHPEAQLAAIEALGRLGDPRSLVDLQRIADSVRATGLTSAAENASESIRSPEDPKSATIGLGERLTALERRYQALEEQLRGLRETAASDEPP